MRRKALSLSLAAVLILFLNGSSHADELSELKGQMRAMQEQMTRMQEKIEALEAERTARPAAYREEDAGIAAAPEKDAAPKDTFRAHWKNGLRLTTDDKKFDLKIGGRIHLDTAWTKEESAVKGRFGTLKDSAEFRRVYLETAGTIYDSFIYKVEVTLIDGEANFDDLYMGLKDIPYVGELKIGHFKEPFGLEEMESSNYTTFMERSLPIAFAPDRNMGIGLNSNLLDKRLTWAIGTFRDSDGFGNVISNEWNFTGRLTGLPWYEDKGKKLLHLGAAYSFRNPEENAQYRSRPECHLAPYFADTGTFPVKNINLVGLEGGFKYRSLLLKGEFMNSYADRLHDTKYAYFSGVYGQVSYVLTGEDQNYDMAVGRFANIEPFNDFSIAERKMGAWEVAARYSYLDLKDPGINGGILSDATLGLNWYLNPNMRIMWNYVHANRNGLGYADILESRFQVNF
ncbi:MAG: porin [Candidatus Omnitrophota bacterium]